MPHPKKKVIIIGGGITGLSTAYFLEEAFKKNNLGIDCLLIEADRRLGGKIVSEQVDDFIIEGGPDSFITQKRWGLALCQRLGLTGQLVQTRPVEKAIYVLSHGKLVPFPQGFNLMVPGHVIPFLLSPLVSPFGKARMGLDLLIPRKDSEGDESIASFVRRRLGEEAVQKFAEPILAGIFAGDAEKLSMKACFPQFVMLEKSYGSLIWGMWMRRWNAAQKGKPAPKWSMFVTLQEGLSSLITAIREKLEQTTITIGEPVEEIEPLGKGYMVLVGKKRHLADAVVVTTNAYTAADWIKRWDCSLSKILQETTYVSTATVSLGFQKKDVSHPLNGFGFVVPRKEGFGMMASTWSSTKFPSRAPEGSVLIRAFLGGALQENLIEQDDLSLIALVRKEVELILGIKAEPVVSRAFRWIKANPQYHIGHLERVAEIEKRVAQHDGLYLTGAAYRGVGIPDCIEQGMKTSEKIVKWFRTYPVPE